MHIETLKWCISNITRDGEDDRGRTQRDTEGLTKQQEVIVPFEIGKKSIKTDVFRPVRPENNQNLYEVNEPLAMISPFIWYQNHEQNSEVNSIVFCLFVCGDIILKCLRFKATNVL